MEVDNHATDDSSDRDVVRIVLISDTHGLHSHVRMPPDGGDVLIHCGDFANRGSVADVHSFRDWMQSQTSFKERVVIAGNHDRDLKQLDAIDLRAEFSKATSNSSVPITFLDDESIRCAEGRLHIFGISWKTCEQRGYENLNLANLEGGNSPVDILLSHVPPYWPSPTSRIKKGSISLASFALKQRIPICCGGHLHWARGAVQYMETNGGVSSSYWFINASTKRPRRDDEAVFPPIIIDYNVQDRQVVRIQGLDSNSDILQTRIPSPFENVVRL